MNYTDILIIGGFDALMATARQSRDFSREMLDELEDLARDGLTPLSAEGVALLLDEQS